MKLHALPTRLLHNHTPIIPVEVAVEEVVAAEKPCIAYVDASISVARYGSPDLSLLLETQVRRRAAELINTGGAEPLRIEKLRHLLEIPQVDDPQCTKVSASTATEEVIADHYPVGAYHAVHNQLEGHGHAPLAAFYCTVRLRIARMIAAGKAGNWEFTLKAVRDLAATDYNELGD